MELNLPGGEEALQKVFRHYPWAAFAELALVAASVALNLTLAALMACNPKRLKILRLGPAPWSFARGVELMARYGLAYFGVMILMLMLKQEFGPPLREAGFGDLHLTAFGTALILILSLGLVALFSRRQTREKRAALAAYWKGPSARRAMLGIPLFVMMVGPIGLVMLLTQLAFHWMGWPFDPQPIVTELQKTDATWFVAVLSVFAVTAAPLVEEMFFRGILYPTLRERWGIVPAVLIGSLIFAVMHFHLPTLLPLFTLAVILCLAFEYTGSLPVCVIAHALFNSVSIAAIWLLRSLR